MAAGLQLFSELLCNNLQVATWTFAEHRSLMLRSVAKHGKAWHHCRGAFQLDFDACVADWGDEDTIGFSVTISSLQRLGRWQQLG